MGGRGHGRLADLLLKPSSWQRPLHPGYIPDRRKKSAVADLQQTFSRINMLAEITLTGLTREAIEIVLDGLPHADLPIPTPWLNEFIALRGAIPSLSWRPSEACLKITF